MSTPPSARAPSPARPSGDGAHRPRLVLGAALVAVVDLASKAAAVAALPAGGLALPGPVDLRLAHNRGVAFSAGTALPAWLIISFTAAATLALVVAAWRGVLPSSMGAALMIGGAAANLLDRLHGGSVVDLLHTGWWPTFNLADIALTTGVAWTLLTGLRQPTPTGPPVGATVPVPPRGTD